MDTWQALSNVCGIIYSFAWNISFYPQAWQTYKRKHISGFSLEYALLNPMGYFLYAIYTTSGTIYPNIGTGVVDWSDTFFAWHGLSLSTLIFTQCLIYQKEESNKDFKLWCWLLIALEILVLLVIFILEMSHVSLPKGAHLVNFCGYGKALISLVKYTP